MKSFRVIASVVLFAASFVSPSSPLMAGLITYQFINIADTTGELSGFQRPSVNNLGVVAYAATLDAGGTMIYKGDGTSTTIIAAINGNTPIPRINDNGVVTIHNQSLAPLGSGIHKGDGTTTTQISPIWLADSGWINNAGTVAFSGWTDFIGGTEAIIIGDGGATTILYDNTGAYSRVENPSLNESGVVAFRARLDAGGSQIVAGTGGAVTVIADTTGAFDEFSWTSLNENGAVGFAASLDSGIEGIFVGDGTTMTTVADTTGEFSDFGDFSSEVLNIPSLNDGGDVAFHAFLDAGGEGIFTGADPVMNRVIGSGDLLFGSEIASLSLYAQGLNNSGQIAFLAEFTDGSSSIVLATPVPEPSTFVLLGIGGMGLIAVGVRRSRKGR